MSSTTVASRENMKKLVEQCGYSIPSEEVLDLYVDLMKEDAPKFELKQATFDQLRRWGTCCELKRDMKQAVVYWKLAAEQKDEIAMTLLGYYYSDQNDLVEAVRWWKSAAEHGCKVSMYRYGCKLLEQNDWITGITWIHKSQRADTGKCHKWILDAKDNVHTLIMKLIEKNQELEAQNKKLQEENNELRYQPGPGFIDAQQDFATAASVQALNLKKLRTNVK
jgi:TPR repeat protein